MVNAPPDFKTTLSSHQCFSDLMVEVFGEKAEKHARPAIGMRLPAQ